jgi:hypothetical protein
MIEQLADRVNDNEGLVLRGRYANFSFLLGIGDADFLITIEHGRVIGVRPRRVKIDSGCFTIRASSEIWKEFWQPIPKRDHHDLFSMIAAGLAQIDGDLLPFFQNLLYIKELLAAPRSFPAGV